MIVVLGAAGQVGRSLVEAAAERGSAVRGLSRAECDITDRSNLAAAVEGARLVVNAAAYTAVDKAESEHEAAFRINAEAPGLIAQACAAAGIPLVHISTDYVFDGSGDRPWREDDPTNPLNTYGRSKLAGEEAVRAALPEHVILRTSWVVSEHGQNFVKTMRRLAATRPEIKVVADQHGGPTSAAAIADAILRVSDALESGRKAWGTYHFSGAPATTWYDFARAILADQPEVTISPIPTTAYPTPAARPGNSVLDCRRIANTFGIEQPDWRADLARICAGMHPRG